MLVVRLAYLLGDSGLEACVFATFSSRGFGLGILIFWNFLRNLRIRHACGVVESIIAERLPEVIVRDPMVQPVKKIRIRCKSDRLHGAEYGSVIPIDRQHAIRNNCRL